MGGAQSGESREPDSTERRAADAVSAFLDARRQDPQASAKDFIPANPGQAEAFRKAVDGLGLLCNGSDTDERSGGASEGAVSDGGPVLKADMGWGKRQDLTFSFDVEALESEVSEGDLLRDAGAVSRYEILEKIGEGGMGEVYRAKDRRLGRTVVLKRIHPEKHKSSQALQRFIQEARAIASLNHFNIVQVYDIGRDDQGHYIAMEFVAGESLREYLKHAGAQPLAYALELGRSLCRALEVAHRQGVIHRDIKPANILLTTAGVPKLVDFGLASTGGDGALTASGMALGTPHYAAPEQFGDARHVDTRADIYSLAATLYEVLTGESPRHYVESKLPVAVRPVLRKAMEEDPERRYRSVVELEDALRNIAAALSSAEMAGEHKPAVVLCPECGHENRGEVEFCGVCGFELGHTRAVATHMEQAQAHAAAGAAEQALHHYEAVLELVPDHQAAGEAAEVIRQRLTRLSTLRARANALSARGAVREALAVWRDVLALEPGDAEAAAQLEKCDEQMRAHQIGALLSGARDAIKHHRFTLADEKCGAVLRQDPGNAEALALVPRIAQAQVAWIRSQIKAGVRAYRARDFGGAFERFEAAYGEAKDFESEAQLQKLIEGMEMARLVPTLEQLHESDQAFNDAMAQLEQLMREYTSPRAKAIIKQSQESLRDRYWAQMAVEARRASEAQKEVEQERRQFRVRLAVGAILVVALLIGGPLVSRWVTRARLPGKITAACAAGDYEQALERVNEYVRLGGERAAVAPACEQLRAELGRRLGQDWHGDARRWAATLAPLSGQQDSALLNALCLANFDAAQDAAHWSTAVAALEQMVRLSGGDAARETDFTDRLETVVRWAEQAYGPEADEAARAVAGPVLDRLLSQGSALAGLLARDRVQHLRTLQLETAIRMEAREDAARYAAELDRATPQRQLGRGRLREQVAGLRTAADALAEKGELARAAEKLRAAGAWLTTLAGDESLAKRLRQSWAALLDTAITQEAWEDARRIADECDAACGDDRTGRARLDAEQAVLLNRARQSVTDNRAAAARHWMLGALKCRCPVGEVTDLIKTMARKSDDSVGRAYVYDLIVSLEEAEPGRGVARAGFRDLLDVSIQARDRTHVQHCIAALNAVDEGTGQERLDTQLDAGPLREVARKIRTDRQQEAIAQLAEWQPLLDLSRTAWPSFCREHGEALIEPIRLAATQAERDEASRDHLDKLAELLDACSGS